MPYDCDVLQNIEWKYKHQKHLQLISVRGYRLGWAMNYNSPPLDKQDRSEKCMKTY